MTSKNLAIREDVYKRLVESKKADESFSDVIERLLEGRQDGIFVTDRYFAHILDDIERMGRDAAPRRLVERRR